MALSWANPRSSGVAGDVSLAQPRSIGEILGCALRLYARHPLLFFTLAFGVIAPYNLAVLAITGGGTTSGLHDGVLVRWTLTAVNLSLIGPLISALHVRAVAVIGEGRTPRSLDIALHGLRVLPTVIVAELVVSLLVIFGLLAFVIPGFLLTLQWSVVSQSAAMQQRKWREALDHSRRLTDHHYIHILGLMILTWTVLAVRLSIVTAFVGKHSGVGLVILGIILDVAATSFAALAMAVLYFDLSARYEQRHLRI